MFQKVTCFYVRALVHMTNTHEMGSTKRSLGFWPTGNRFHSEFFEPWCHLVNQPALPSVLSSTTVINNASVMEGIAQSTKELNSGHQLVPS